MSTRQLVNKIKAMKRLIISLFVIVVAFSTAMAQKRTVEQIRKVYNETVAAAAKANEYESMLNCVTINRREMMHGIGWQEGKVEIYYAREEYDPDIHGDKMDNSHPVLIRESYNVAARTYYREFLYDKDGLMFCMFKDGDNNANEPAEKRFYFNGKYLIKSIPSGYSHINAYNLGIRLQDFAKVIIANAAIDLRTGEQ